MSFLARVNPNHNTGEAVFNLAHLAGRGACALAQMVGQIFYAKKPELPLDCVAIIVEMIGHDPHKIGNSHIIYAKQFWAKAVLPKVVVLPEFADILNDDDSKNPLKSLVQLARFAKTKMTAKQYATIKAKYPNPVCTAFFIELAEQIRANKDHATTQLAQVVCKTLHLDLDTVITQHPAPSRIESIRAWLNSPEMGALRLLIRHLDLSHSSLAVLPDELRLFPQLEILDLSDNLLTAITAIDVSTLTALERLSLAGNQLTEVNLSNLTGLRTLVLADNLLTEINVSTLIALKQLSLSNNLLTAIDVSTLTALEVLSLNGNQLTEVNLSDLTGLMALDLSQNQLTEVDISALLLLNNLNLSDNLLTEVDISNLTELKMLDLSDNQLTATDVSHLTQLISLNLSQNQFSLTARIRLAWRLATIILT